MVRHKKSERRLLDCNHCCCDYVNEKPVSKVWSSKVWSESRLRTTIDASIINNFYSCEFEEPNTLMKLVFSLRIRATMPSITRSLCLENPPLPHPPAVKDGRTNPCKFCENSVIDRTTGSSSNLAQLGFFTTEVSLPYSRATNPSSNLAKLVFFTTQVSLLYYRATKASSNLAKLIFSTTEVHFCTTERRARPPTWPSSFSLLQKYHFCTTERRVRPPTWPSPLALLQK